MTARQSLDVCEFDIENSLCLTVVARWHSEYAQTLTSPKEPSGWIVDDVLYGKTSILSELDSEQLANIQRDINRA